LPHKTLRIAKLSIKLQ